MRFYSVFLAMGSLLCAGVVMVTASPVDVCSNGCDCEEVKNATEPCHEGVTLCSSETGGEVACGEAQGYVINDFPKGCKTTLGDHGGGVDENGDPILQYLETNCSASSEKCYRKYQCVINLYSGVCEVNPSSPVGSWVYKNKDYTQDCFGS